MYTLPYSSKDAARLNRESKKYHEIEQAALAEAYYHAALVYIARASRAGRTHTAVYIPNECLEKTAEIFAEHGYLITDKLLNDDYRKTHPTRHVIEWGE